MTETMASCSAPAHDEAQRCRLLIALFNQLFLASHNTILEKGDDEPIYLPAGADHPHHRIIFAHGYFSSALHEIAHWCVAGRKRRRLIDFGYWYKPDGRTLAQQRAFEQVEVKPQALEWILSMAAGHRFHFSADNLTGARTDMRAFRQAVHVQVGAYLSKGLSPRVARLTQGLAQTFPPSSAYLDVAQYHLPPDA